jgi:hypothetical protein
MRRQYKETPRPAGIFAVRNVPEDKMLVGQSPDLPGMLNRQRFQLEMGSHPDRELQADWNRLGAEAFVFEVLDELDVPSDPGYQASDDLAALRDVWLERLSGSGQSLYPFSSRGA